MNTTTVAERERIKEIVENNINSVQNLILVVPNIGIGIESIRTASRSAPAILALERVPKKTVKFLLSNMEHGILRNNTHGTPREHGTEPKLLQLLMEPFHTFILL